MQNIFDITSSTAANDSSYNKMGKSEFIEQVLPKLRSILARQFPGDPNRQRIKVYKDRISFAAPCCGDSATNSYKKRGNIILEGRFKNMYKCFNCGTCMQVQNFFKRYGENLSLGEINYIAENAPNIKGYSKAVGSDSMKYLYDVDTIEELSIPREDFKGILGLEECDSPNLGHDYLASRGQTDFSKFLYSTRAGKLFILNLTPGGKVMGIQVRHFDKKGPKYKTYSLQKLHTMILRDSDEIPDDINSLSMIFNILLIDCNYVVNVLEGPMDSFLVKNAIATCGAGKNIDFPFEHRYIFDSDATGVAHSVEKLKEGYSVFMWDKFIKDAGLPSRKKWDMNDAISYARSKRLRLPPIDGYFTNDGLDLILI